MTVKWISARTCSTSVFNADRTLSRHCFDIRHWDGQAQLAVTRGEIVERIAQSFERAALVSLHDLLPSIEEAEFDEVVIEQGGSVGEAHHGLTLDDANDGEAARFEQIADVGGGG